VELSLSRRELELVRHIFAGRRLREIAREMSLGFGTVKSYSQRIHHKLRIRDQRELILTVFQAYLGPPPG
jgi:DNA-binding NarL/FixJ family response regulator